MSEFVNVPLGINTEALDTSPKFPPYSGVEIIINDDESIFVGSRSGRVLSFTNPLGTEEQANNILTSLKATGFQYQPYTASRASLNPAAEIGDGVTVNGVYSGIYRIARNLSSLISDIEAPKEDEIDHEYPFESRQDRVFRRQIEKAQSSISLNQEKIEAEVIRATGAEGSLSSLITQTANEINATVSGKLSASGGSSQSFGWTLTSTSWTLKANGATVFSVNKDGATVSGVIKATSGSIGGFAIGANAIFKGMDKLSSTAQGVYVGTDGISVGGGKFKVTSSGAVSAANMTLTGTLNIGGTNISAAALRSGAQSAYNNSGTWNSTSSGWSGATSNNSSTRPNIFGVNSLYASSNAYIRGKLWVDRNGYSTQAKWLSQQVVTGIKVYYSGGMVDDVGASYKTIYYLGDD